MILDSCFIIDLLNGVQEANKFAIENESKVLWVSSITVFEVMNGLKKDSDFFDNLLILNFTKKDAILASSIWKELKRKGQMIDPMDIFIGATAINNGFSVVTRNSKHFKNIKGVELVEY